jgi:O-methyltransferase involved in polyketide biosynthesis
MVDERLRSDLVTCPDATEHAAPKEQPQQDGIVPGIDGVSETMLWSLYNRASEARRADSILADPESVCIQAAIDYDFASHFGDPQGLLAARAAEIDRVLRSWIEQHPDGIVVSLGEGLETQARRVDNGRVRWLSVDLPDAIRLRERFLLPTDRFQHVAASALDPAWMDSVDPSSGVFIVAQGLLMYLAPEEVRGLLVMIAGRFPGAELVFDAIPRWFSYLTRLGVQQTASYRLPSMPWGIDCDEVEPTLRHWLPNVVAVAVLPYRSPRGLPHLFAGIADQIPVARHAVPSLVRITTAKAGQLVTPSTEPSMTASKEHTSTVDAFDGFLAAANEHARFGGDIAIAATQVVAKRVALGMAATFNPLGADRAEFSRMVPEKVEAFSTAGMAMLKQSGAANRQMLSLATDEVMTAARATMEMSRCGSLTALAEAQGSFARAWFDRLTSRLLLLGVGLVEAQSAAMAPIRQTVVANAERLAR